MKEIRTQGTIAAWRRKEGYGFIKAGGRTFWGHAKEFRRPVNKDLLKEGVSVVFTYRPDETVSKGFPGAYELQLEGQDDAT